MWGGSVSSEQNKVIVRQLIEGFFNTGDPDLADEVLSEDYIDHSPSHPDLSGPENVKQAVSEWRNAFPDTVSVVQDMVAEGDKVAARWTTQATHQGEFMDFAPTGNQVDVTWFGIFYLSEGKIVESWDTFNVVELMQQLKS
jgi:steroid delta-isomerase-like uncharacterized protein